MLTVYGFLMESSAFNALARSITVTGPAAMMTLQ